MMERLVRLYTYAAAAANFEIITNFLLSIQLLFKSTMFQVLLYILDINELQKLSSSKIKMADSI